MKHQIKLFRVQDLYSDEIFVTTEYDVHRHQILNTNVIDLVYSDNEVSFLLLEK